MNTVNNRQLSQTPRQKSVTKLAVTDFNHPSFNLVQPSSAKQYLTSVEKSAVVKDNELVIATQPEAVVIIGYVEFGNNLEIYGSNTSKLF